MHDIREDKVPICTIHDDYSRIISTEKMTSIRTRFIFKLQVVTFTISYQICSCGMRDSGLFLFLSVNCVSYSQRMRTIFIDIIVVVLCQFVFKIAQCSCTYEKRSFEIPICDSR